MNRSPHIAIACGGTGGHLFPGVAVASALVARGCRVTLLTTSKEVDRQGAEGLTGVRIETLPAVPPTAGKLASVRGAVQSLARSRAVFRADPPQAVLGMGGFCSVGPILAGRLRGAQVFLHEANAVPGRANRWLARLADAVFITFPESAARLRSGWRELTGMPVRPAFTGGEAAAARAALGLDPARDVLLVMGGSQGARAINDTVTQSLDAFCARHPGLQFIHLTGAKDFDAMAARYAASSVKAFVKPFHHDMATLFRAATAAVSRAGASSIAECAAMRLPSVLVPYPHAADDHQRANAASLAAAGGAAVIDPAEFSPAVLLAAVDELMRPETRAAMGAALAGWHKPAAAEDVAALMLRRLGISAAPRAGETSARGSVFTLPNQPQPATP